ncbi:MAG: hypothetical protein SGPRY_007214, partial [Prymnesium sp.]
LSRQLSPYLSASMGVIPQDLVGPCGTPPPAARKSFVTHTHFCVGVNSAYWARIHDNLGSFQTLKHFKGQLANSGLTRALMGRLMMGLGVSVGTPYVRMMGLDIALTRLDKSSVISELFSGGSTASDVVETVLESHATVGAGGSLSTGATGGVEGSGASTVHLAQREFERELSAASFLEAAEGMRGQTTLSQLELAALSGSILLLRYLFFSPNWMKSRHAVFDCLSKCLPERDNYLARCVVLDLEADKVPSNLSTYRLSPAQAVAFWELRWSELDMISSVLGQPEVGGFLAQRYLENGTIYGQVASFEHYVVETTLNGIN